MTAPDPLDTLTRLRQESGLSLSDMARRCGLRGKQSHQTAGAWERGEYTPKESRRADFIGYLWDDLRLRRDPARFEALWTALVEQWKWAPMESAEWQQHFPGVAQPSRIPSPAHEQEAVAETGAGTNLETNLEANRESSTIPAGRRQQPPPFQAPPQVPHFVGRNAHLQELVARLAPTVGAPNVVALVGMAGVGKTALATHLAHEVREHFRDGVLWGSAATGTLVDVLHSWALACGSDLRHMTDLENLAAAVRTLLADRRALLVIDDAGSVERVRTLLPGTSGCTVLITTRDREVASGLGASVTPVDVLTPDASLALLIEMLGVERVEQEREAAAAICAWMHGLPLAVELVVQFLRARPRRTLHVMAQRLQSDPRQRLDLRVSDRCLRTPLAASCKTLDRAHGDLFARLAVFEGRAFTLEAAAHVAELNPWQAQDRLETLSVRSLLREEDLWEEDLWEESPVRYRQHGLLADVAREELGEDEGPFLRMAEYFLALARAHETVPSQLEADWENVMAGMAAAHRLKAWEMVLDYADALAHAWADGMRYHDARQGYAWACIAAQEIDRQNELARFLCLWGGVCTEQNAYTEADSLLRQSLALAQRLKLELTVADARFGLARIAIEGARYEEAAQQLRDCKRLRQAWSDEAGVAGVLYWQAMLAYRTGDYDAAHALCLEALHIQRNRTIPHGGASSAAAIPTLRLLVDIEVERGNLVAAAAHGQEALALVEAMGHERERGAVLYSLATVHRYAEEYAQAEQYVLEAQQIFRRTGSRAFYAYTLFELSHIRNCLGDTAHALKSIAACNRILQSIGDEFNLVWGLRHIGDLYGGVQSIDAALTVWRQAREIAQRVRHPALKSLRERIQAAQLAGESV